MSMWDSISMGAKKAGDAAAIQARKGKLKADIILLDREALVRKKAFGVAMYDHVSPLSQSADFYAATDELTNLLRPPLIMAQKEIQALAAKRVKLKEALAGAEANRAGAFPNKAESVGQKLAALGKLSVLHGGETKIKTELAIVDRKIKGFKQTFGVELFDSLAEAEDQRGYLPTNRQVRNMYDSCRGDVQRIEDKRKEKGEEIVALGGTAPTRGKSTKDPTEPTMNVSQPTQTFQPPNGPSMLSHSAPAGGFSGKTPTGTSSGYSNPSYTPTTTNAYSNSTPGTGSQSDTYGDDLLLEM